MLVTGQDAELAACQRIARGMQSMTIYKPLKRLAAAAAEAAARMARGRPVVAKAEVDDGQGKVPAVLMEVTTVTRENLKETVIRDGFQDLEDVFGR